MTDPVPSKDLVSQLRLNATAVEHGGYMHAAFLMREAVGEIENLRRENDGLTRDCNDKDITIERLRRALHGIQSCSTCEACRGAATLALGGATPEPAAECTRCHCQERAQRFAGDQRVGVSVAGLMFTHWSKDPLIPYKGCNCSSCDDARTLVRTDVSDGTAQPPEECPENNCGLPGCPACFPPTVQPAADVRDEEC